MINYQTVSADNSLLLFVSPDWSVPMVAVFIPRVLKATCSILNSVHYALTIKTGCQNKHVVSRSHNTQWWCFGVAFKKTVGLCVQVMRTTLLRTVLILFFHLYLGFASCTFLWQISIYVYHCGRFYEGESHGNLKLHVASGAAIFTLLLHHHVAFLHRTATCRPLFKPWVSLLSTYRQSSCVSNFYLTFEVFIRPSLVVCVFRPACLSAFLTRLSLAVIMSRRWWTNYWVRNSGGMIVIGENERT